MYGNLFHTYSGLREQIKHGMKIKDKMEIQELHNYTQAQFEDLKQLMSELMEQRVEKECSHSLSRVATEEAKGQLSDRVNFTVTVR